MWPDVILFSQSYSRIGFGHTDTRPGHSMFGDGNRSVTSAPSNSSSLFIILHATDRIHFAIVAIMSNDFDDMHS